MDSTKKIKVGIVGLGPVGMIMAVFLKKAGCDVALCIRNTVKREKITNEGIVLHNVFEMKASFEIVVPKIDELASFEPDYLVFATKTYHIKEALESASLLNSERLSVVVAQNGIDIEQLYVPAFGESKIIRMVVNFAGIIVAPNVIKVSFFSPPNYIGSINDKSTTQASEFAALLSKVNLTTTNVNSFELLKRTWEKTILNSSLSALCGVGRLTMAEAMNDPDTVELIEQTIAEAVLVAGTEKIHFTDDFIRHCMRYLKNGGDHFPSLALDLINNRPTEIDYLNGKIVEYGRKHYVRTSLNLSFTNMVKAMSNKNIISRIPGIDGEVFRKVLNKGLVDKSLSGKYKNGICFLGIDLGSAYSKFVVIDEGGHQLFRYMIPTLNSDQQAFKNVMLSISSNFNIKYSCATGYGRKHYMECDMTKTEINCAAAGVTFYKQGEKNIIDIGGEDIKIIKCNKENNVENFYMNDKCAAGTGSFLSEIAERAGIAISDMSNLAALSKYEQELNSFCTVFAKTEIMNWIFDGMTPEDLSRGIYNSIGNKIAKMRLDAGMPVYLIGGVIAHHGFLKSLLAEKFNREVTVIENPQYVVAFGAALFAQKAYQLAGKESRLKTENVNT